MPTPAGAATPAGMAAASMLASGGSAPGGYGMDLAGGVAAGAAAMAGPNKLEDLPVMVQGVMGEDPAPVGVAMTLAPLGLPSPPGTRSTSAPFPTPLPAPVPSSLYEGALSGGTLLPGLGSATRPLDEEPASDVDFT